METYVCRQVWVKGVGALLGCATVLSTLGCSLAVSSVEAPQSASTSTSSAVIPAAVAFTPVSTVLAPQLPAAGVAKQLSSPPTVSSLAAELPWPLSYTVELDSAGELRADGRQLSSVKELESASRLAAGKGAFATVIFFASPGAPSSQRTAVTQTLVGSGFAQVKVVGRAAPRRLRGLKAVGLARRVSISNSSPAFPAVGTVSSASVVVKTVGLHVGGGARTEASRQRLVRHFEEYFPQLAECHQYAGDREKNASFGIDVYVPVSGGSPKLGQVRSRLRGKQFRRCMLRKFRAMKFPPPESGRRTAISYSLLFKPVRESRR